MMTSAPHDPNVEATRRRLSVAALASIFLVLISHVCWPSATWGFCIVAGWCTLFWGCRRVSDDPLLARITLASYGIRVVLTLVLFGISLWHLPILSHVQRGQGFWQIGADGIGYHQHALRILTAWSSGIDLPSAFHDGLEEHSLYKDLALPLALLYRLIGASPLHGLLFNAWIGALATVPGYQLVNTLSGERGARRTAILIGFWPSFIIWSTQLLKEGFVALAILTFFYCLAVVWRHLNPGVQNGDRRRWVMIWVYWGGLLASVIAVTYFRFYTGCIILAALSVVMGIIGFRHIVRRQWAAAAAPILLMVSVSLAIVLTRSVNFLELFSPPHAEIAQLTIGSTYEQSGDLERAALSYIRAIEINPQYVVARDRLRSLVAKVVDATGPLCEYQGVLLDREGHLVLMHEGVTVNRFIIAKATQLMSDRTPQLPVMEPVATDRGAGRSMEAIARSASTPHASVTTPLATTDSMTPHASVTTPIPVTNTTPRGLLVRRAVVQVKELIDLATIRRVNDYRQNMIRVGGHFTVDKDVVFHHVGDLLLHLPKALMLAFLSPFPTQWFDTGGETGAFRMFSAIEVILLVILLPAMVLACWSLVKHHGAVGQVMVLFIVLAALLLSCVVINIGILFRLRLQYLLPLLVALGVRAPYQTLQQAWHHLCQHKVAGVPKPEVESAMRW